MEKGLKIQMNKMHQESKEEQFKYHFYFFWTCKIFWMIYGERIPMNCGDGQTFQYIGMKQTYIQ